MATKKTTTKATGKKTTVNKKPPTAAEKRAASRAATLAAKKKAEAEIKVAPPVDDPEVEAARAELARLKEVVDDPAELLNLTQSAIYYHTSHGRPEVAAKIKVKFESDTPLTRHELRTDGVHPYLEPVPEIEEPARAGPGSGIEMWREYALVVAKDIIDEDTILDALRDDLIGMLEANGLIERVVEGA